MSAETQPIYRLFTDEQLAAHEQERQNAFEAVVMARIRAFMEEHRERIGGCAIDIAANIVSVAFGQLSAHDSELEDALTEQESALSDEGWPDVYCALLPGNPDEEQLRDFARFQVRRLLSNE